MSQSMLASATWTRPLTLRPATLPLSMVSAQGRSFSQVNRLQGKEWRNGTSKGYIYKPKDLIEPKWDELQKMMKWRSLAYKEYFQGLFGSSNPLMAKREWYQWVKATPDRNMRDEIKAKELETLHREVQEAVRFVEEFANNYSNLCSQIALKKVVEVLSGNATGQALFDEDHKEGDPVLEAELESRVRRFVDEMLKAGRVADETGEPMMGPKFEPVSELRRQSRERYGSTFKEPEELAEYKKKYSDLMAPEKEKAEPTDRVYDPISQRMVPAAGGVGKRVKAPGEDELAEREEAKKKDPNEGEEGDKNKVRSNNICANTQHDDYMLQIERMKKTLTSWTNWKTGMSEACSSAPAKAKNDTVQRPSLTQFNRETEIAGSGPRVLGRGEERGGVNSDLWGVGGLARGSNGNHEKKLYDLTRDVKNTTDIPQTQGSSSCSSSPSVNSVPSALSSEPAAQIGAVSAGKDTVLADSGSPSIPKSISNYATKAAEISKALDTLSSMQRDQDNAGESVASVPQSITDFNAKIAELKRALETLDPVLRQSNNNLPSPDLDPPKPSPLPAPRLQSALDRIASTPKSRPNISESEESLGAAAAQSRGPPDSIQHKQTVSVEDPISRPPTSDTEPQPKIVYKVLAYDSGNDILTTSITTTPPRPGYQESSLSLPDALSMLSNPSKFVPYLPTNFEPVLASANLLVLRETPDIVALEEPIGDTGNDIEPPPNVQKQEHPDVNPVDGTTAPFPEAAVGNYASPTGFVNYNQLSPVSDDQPLDSEAAAQLRGKGHANQHEEETHERNRERYGGGHHRYGRRRHGRWQRRGHGGAASVTKTAILGVSACYIAGVVGEVVEPRR
ncbi:uncharacterized protein BDZ99DRAFT_524605 [Mytilinidion resinicola]|uniref:Uncharacterized protein n=1 Tax=Mytilinidion resinicola TaxID=574789 RepID=A0A6A6YCS8_9PEZI|nr:uncharacterized protein BDZ99DRAFT_524605 [Mytilinidion resinicola]KAF2805647.1 hypothetical protein BDZ99DRAFT_524605 [Mytilinidion resinicola]